MELLKKLLEFKPDPEATEVVYGSPLHFHFYQLDYSQILKEGLPLLKTASYEVACILIDTLDQMFSFTVHSDEINDDENSSYIWCPTINELSSEDQREYLTFTLVSICEKIYQNNPEHIEELDKGLRKRWKIFQRIRQYLYSLNPSEQTKPWIREEILKYKYDHRHGYDCELQRMIHSANSHFKNELLTQEELTQIFEKILSGPSKKNYKQWLELGQEQISEDSFENSFKERQIYFQRLQFGPFQSVLFGKYKEVFQRLEAQQSKDAISDESYMPFRISSGNVSFYSPKSKEELAQFTDQELLDYINEWEDESYDGIRFREIDITSLAETFEMLFKEQISQDTKRLHFWIENRHRIQRPIYIKAILNGSGIDILKTSVNILSQWFEFCKWVLSHNNKSYQKDLIYSDHLKDNSSWHSSHRAVIDFIKNCIKQIAKEQKNPQEQVIEKIIEILKLFYTQFDHELDQNQDKISKNATNYLHIAVNNTRCRALEQLLQFAYDLKENNPSEDVSKIFSVLEERLKDDAKYPLTLPEYAILGFCYGQIYHTNKNWLVQNKSKLFPQKHLDKWIAIFNMVLHKQPPHSKIFELLKDDFEFALKQIDFIKKTDLNSQKGMTDHLGRYLLFYYLRDLYPLKGHKDCLLEKFYEKADIKHKKNLFDWIGELFKNNEDRPDKAIKDKLIAFFDWRLEVKDPSELTGFVFWFGAECLDAKWRLEKFSKILDIYQNKDNHLDLYWPIKTLHKMRTKYPEEVMMCFAKLPHPLDRIVMLVDKEIRDILCLRSQNPEVLSKIEEIKEHYLKIGYFNVSDMEK